MRGSAPELAAGIETIMRKFYNGLKDVDQEMADYTFNKICKRFKNSPEENVVNDLKAADLSLEKLAACMAKKNF